MSTTLLLIETSANQPYIFATNRLREQIGASEIIFRSATRWLQEALGASGAGDAPAAWRQQIEQSDGRLAAGVELVLSTSGKALLICNERARAHALLRDLTARALEQAPGLQLAGAIVDLPDRADPQAAAGAVRAVHARFARHRQALGMQTARLPVLPLAEPCATSGLPASWIRRLDQLAEPISASSAAKALAAQNWSKRVNALLAYRQAGFRVARTLDELEADFQQRWVGLLHADGNGLGQIILAFDRWLAQGEDYFGTLRRFSLELEDSTEAAFVAAAQAAWSVSSQPPETKASRLPVVPLVLGGDDLTAAIAGVDALSFTVSFLDAFERETARRATLARIAHKALGAARLSMAAGLALVKPHFPYALGYELAESLTESAKQVKRHVTERGGPDKPLPCSAFDVHVLFDASGADLQVIRTRRRGGAGEGLWGGPYVATPLAALGAADGQPWADAHHVDRLMRTVRAIQGRDTDGRPLLPRSQMHALREALSRGRAEADAVFAAIRKRYPQAQALEADTGSVFLGAGEEARTVFLDALTLSDFRAAESGRPLAEDAV